MQKYPGQKSGSWRYHYEGFDYREDNLKTVKTREYRCIQNKCRGRAVHPRDDPDAVKVKGIHNHPRNRSDFRTWKFRKCLKDRATSDLNTPIGTLFRDISIEYADVAEFVDPVAERRKMRRARMKLLPKCPSDYDELAELLVNDNQIKSMCSGLDDEKFFQTVLNVRHGTTLIFASPYLLEKCLAKSKTGKMDATFKVLPRKPKGRQLLSVHATALMELGIS